MPNDICRPKGSKTKTKTSPSQTDRARGEFGAIGGDGEFEALLQVDLRLPAEGTDERRVAELARRAVGLRRVPLDLRGRTGSGLHRLGEFADRHLFAGADVHEVRRIVERQREEAGGREIVHVEELADRRAGAPERDDFLHRLELADQRRQDVSVDDVVVVAGSVKIGRHQRMIKQSALTAQELAELEAGDLRQRITLVRLLKLARQERVLRNRLRRHARIDAGRAEEQEPLHARFRRAPDRVHRDHLVFVEETRIRRAVRADATDTRRRDDRDIRLFGLVELAHRLRIQKIELLVRTGHDVPVTRLLERADARRAHHAAVARDEDPVRLKHP